MSPLRAASACARLRLLATRSGATRGSTRSLSASAAPDAVPPVYVVFGSSGGVGSELCRLLCASGGRVVAVARTPAKADALKASVTGGDLTTHVCANAAAPGAADAALAFALESHGRVDGVSNCIGSVLLKPATSTTDADLAAVMETNLGTSFSILRAAVKAMTRAGAGGGSIVLCSSAVARHGLPNHEAIAAAKAAVMGLTLSAAATYAPQNVRVNAVSPGLTRTPMTARITGNEAALKASMEMHALKRIGEPGDVARAIAFLLDPANSFITGQNLGVDGGLGCLKPR